MPLDHLEQERGSHAAVLLEALMDGGEGGLRRRGRGDVVKADDGLVPGQDHPRLAEHPHDPERVVVGRGDHGRRRHAGREHLPGGHRPTAREVVGGLEDEVVARLQPLRGEGLPVRGQALGDVALGQRAGEGDAPVPVRDQVGHRLDDPVPVVGAHHGTGEALHGVAQHHHGLAGVSEGVEVPGLDGVHHHQEPGDLLPGGPHREVRHQRLAAQGPTEVLAVGTAARDRRAELLLMGSEVEVQGLDGDHPGVRRPGRRGDPRDQVAGVAARDEGREHPDPRVLAPLRLTGHSHASQNGPRSSSQGGWSIGLSAVRDGHHKPGTGS